MSTSSSSTRALVIKSECTLMIHRCLPELQPTDDMAGFDQSDGLGEWLCKACTPLHKGRVNYMTLRAAQHHERHSTEHARNILEAERRMWTLSSGDPEGWAMPSKEDPPLTKEQIRLRESRLHVDMVQDMVPFWIRGMEAAEKGEVLRLEDFLDTLQEASDSWAQSDGWGLQAAEEWENGWGQNTEGPDGWGSANGEGWSGEMASKRDKSGPNRIEAADLGWKTQRSERGQQRNMQHNRSYSKAYYFVEDVARQEAADEERRRRMHNFFEMPTEEKATPIFIAKSVTANPSIDPGRHKSAPTPLHKEPEEKRRNARRQRELEEMAEEERIIAISSGRAPPTMDATSGAAQYGAPQIVVPANSAPHSTVLLAIAARFSDLVEIETACREDEEQRAVRTIDWIGARINKRCAKWTEDLEKLGDKDSHRTPWWDELRRCTDGDHVPSKTEGWNHPVAIILSVSTTSPNPLQAITALHSRAIELPLWVDPNILRYTLIIHPENSPLSDEEAGALFNAVKKQYGLHSYLLPLALPTPPPPVVPVPALIPRLPPPPSHDSLNSNHPIPTPVSPGFPADPAGLNTLRMAEKDIQQTARFAPRTAHNASGQGASGASASPPSQQRRLAEFATILGDLKLAVTVWEALRKDGKGGSDILPLLLSPSPTLPLHASNALAGMHLQLSDPRPQEQLTALRAHELYNDRPQKSLSPSFWESEGQSPFDIHGIDAIMSSIEHPLGKGGQFD
ncbi:hypothetical protein DXG03_008955 [Asterophora parasitica]|uniref:Uncharacterized protein n=1 Tax=Asterophora parasitica TaxID=117018 RepID=A0A9P7GIB7_9AGAR|nr:hypothetical protein DXG03_008955 [Asterophora parasitica]